MNKNEKLVEIIENSKFAVALTGAGVSTLSGIPDFRGAYNPIWEKYPQEKIFNIDYFEKDPGLFYEFLCEILKNKYEPNVSHKVLKYLEDIGKLKAIITQNIDGLHQIAGSKNVYELHGSIYKNYCIKCKKNVSYDEFLNKISNSKIPECDCGGIIRPAIVFFGEMLPERNLQLSIQCAGSADLMLVIGTSLVVQPASFMPIYTYNNNGKIIVINKNETYINDKADIIFTDIKSVFEFLADYYKIKEVKKWQ